MRLEELEREYRKGLVDLLASCDVPSSTDLSRNIQVLTWYLVALTKRWGGQSRYGNPLPIELAVQRSEEEVSKRLKELDAKAMVEALEFLEGVKRDGREGTESETRRSNSDPRERGTFDPPSSKGNDVDYDRIQRKRTELPNEPEGEGELPRNAGDGEVDGDGQAVSSSGGTTPTGGSEEIGPPELSAKAKLFLKSEKFSGKAFS